MLTIYIILFRRFNKLGVAYETSKSYIRFNRYFLINNIIRKICILWIFSADWCFSFFNRLYSIRYIFSSYLIGCFFLFANSITFNYLLHNCFGSADVRMDNTSPEVIITWLVLRKLWNIWAQIFCVHACHEMMCAQSKNNHSTPTSRVCYYALFGLHNTVWM